MLTRRQLMISAIAIASVPQIASARQRDYIVRAFKRQRPLDQRKYRDTGLYESSEWAQEADAEEGGAHWKYTCLATVYAMIEHARGNRNYRIGEKNWTKSGIKAIRGTGPSSRYRVALNATRFVSILYGGNPIIVNGTSRRLGRHGHWVLVVGVDDDANFIAYDPWGGDKITINSRTWKSRGSKAGTFKASSARLVVL